MIKKTQNKKNRGKEFSQRGGFFVLFIALLISHISLAQQEPQYTQYMYNTLSINPAYAGQREVLSATLLHRSQWVGLSGAPKTQTLGIHSPLSNEKMGLGFSVINDVIGPVNSTFVDASFSYTIQLSASLTKMSFGIKAGVHFLNTDWSKGIYQGNDPLYDENVNQVSPLAGVGVYVHNRNWYLGLSVPNLLQTNHYDDYQESMASEEMHFYAIGGYVFDISNSLKFKPAFLVKGVSGAPIIADVSANMLFNDRFTLGLAYRLGDAVSALAGFQVSESFYLGYGYDLTTSNLNNYNSGSHEIMLRFELQEINRILSPRFF
ncbi:type IX secretion system membrane protein PorP/SprF [Flavicella sp.]|uniref:PorP/SprF family type IX secretion system membrane protein n=1 Tax=Flavicella sp. TaxID=2957742 RepID=UPI003017FC42